MKGKIFSILFAVALVISMGLVMAAPSLANGTTYYVNGTTGSDATGDGSQGDPWATIQHAVDDTGILAGDTINVAAGTYDEQIVIDKGLTLQGAGDTTIIRPTQDTVTNSFTLFNRRTPTYAPGPGPTAAIVVVSDVNGSDSATIKDIKIDALNVGTNTPTATKFVEILSTGSNATIDGVIFLGNDDWPDDALYLTPWDQTAVTVEVKNCDFSHFWFNAISANFTGLTANIHNNTITGRGTLTQGNSNYTGSNGIQYGVGCTGTASYNTISNLAIINDDDWVNAGIVFWCTNGTASNNTLTDCQTGVLVQANEAGTFTVTVENNTISAPGLSADVRDIEGINVSANLNSPSITATIQGNDLSGGGLGHGIGIGLTESGDSPHVDATISNNEISGWNNGIWLGGSTETVNITNNTIANNNVNGIDVLAGITLTNVTVDANDITGNTTYGVNNDATGSLDAESNWWGHSSGPYHATANPDGEGDNVSDNVDFCPWYLVPKDNAGTEATDTFGYSSLNVSPAEVDIGQSVTISTIVTNTGGETGSCQMTLKIDGVVTATKEVTVNAGFSKKVTFTIVEDVAGTYSVDVDGLTGSFMVKEKPVPTLPVAPVVPPPPGINWAILGPIIGMVVFLAIFLPIRQRRRRRTA